MILKSVSGLIAFLMAGIILLSSLPVIAAETTDVEIYSISVSDSACVISGRVFDAAEQSLVLSLVQESGSSPAVTATAESLSDGSFMFVTEGIDVKSTDAYIGTIRDADGNTVEFIADLGLSGYMELFDLGLDKGYCIDCIIFEADGLTVGGTHSGNTEAAVAVQAFDASGTFKGLAQTSSDADGRFAVKLDFDSGIYSFYMRADGLEKVSCTITAKSYGDVLAPYPTDVEGVIKRMDRYVQTLESLISQCDAQRISTPYETAKTEIIKKFITHIKKEAEYNDLSRMGEYVYTLTKAYNEAYEALNMYLNGEKTAMSVPEFVTGKLETDGKSFVATTDTNGTQKKRPVFFVGYGPWETAAEEISFFAQIGLNIIQTELNCDWVLKPAPSGYTESDITSTGKLAELEKEALALGIKIEHDKLEWLRSVLKDAEENGVLVDFMLSPHYLPEFVMTKAGVDATEWSGYLPFPLDNTYIKNVISVYARIIAEIVSDYNSCKTICLTNEPAVKAWNMEYYRPQWTAYLEEKYKTIAALNDVYDTSYQSFSDVPLVVSTENSTPQFYDFRCFNDNLLTTFHQWFSDAIKSEYPELLIHIKVMDYLTRNTYRDIVKNGADYEKLESAVDINGCDAHSNYDDWFTPLSLKMGWYDFMTSVKESPVFDSESHIHTDSTEIKYSESRTRYVGADIWNGAIHGRGADVIWLYDLRNMSVPWANSVYSNTNAAFRPADVFETAKAAMDLNRLAEEVTAIQQRDAKVGILYSRTAAGRQHSSEGVINTDYMEYLAPAYEGIIFGGQKAGFVTDSHPEDMHKYELLIVPYAQYVPSEVVSELKKYIENGGEVLITGSRQSLLYDQYGATQDLTDWAYIWSKSDYTENKDCTADVIGKINELGLSEIQLKTADGDTPVNIEWTYVMHGDKILVNVLNHDRETDTELRLYYKGKKVGEMAELITGDTYTDQFTAESLEPMLLEIDRITFDWESLDGTQTEQNISTVKSGKISCNVIDLPQNGVFLMAFYKNGVMDKVVMDNTQMEIEASESDDCRITAMVWDMSMLRPLMEGKSIFMKGEK